MKFRDGLGIKAVTAWTPETIEKAADQVAAGRLAPDAEDRIGVSDLPISTDLAAPEMAVLAGREVLRRSGWDPDRIDLLLHSWIYHQGHPKWSAPHYIAHELGLPDKTLPVGVQSLSHGSASSLFLAGVHLMGDPDAQAVLVTTADRFGPPVWDHWETHTDIVYADGATATLLHRPDGSADVLNLLSFTHGTANVLEGMERGEAPFERAPMEGRQNWSSNDQRSQFYARHGADALGRAAGKHVPETILRALAEAEIAPDDPRIRLVAGPRLGRRLVEMMYRSLADIGLTATLVHLGGHTGHFGAGDATADLADIVDQGWLRPGEIAVVAGAGGGFTWSAAVVQAPLS